MLGVAGCMCLGRHELLRIVLSSTDWACQSWVRVASPELRIIVRQEGFKILNSSFLMRRKHLAFYSMKEIASIGFPSLEEF